MEKVIISALLGLVGSCLFTSCTSVPQDTPTSTVSRDTSTTRTYSK